MPDFGDLARMGGAGQLPAGLRVMVIDDDPMIVSALTQELADRGCEPRGRPRRTRRKRF